MKNKELYEKDLNELSAFVANLLNQNITPLNYIEQLKRDMTNYFEWTYDNEIHLEHIRFELDAADELLEFVIYDTDCKNEYDLSEPYGGELMQEMLDAGMIERKTYFDPDYYYDLNKE